MAPMNIDEMARQSIKVYNHEIDLINQVIEAETDADARKVLQSLDMDLICDALTILAISKADSIKILSDGLA